VALSKKLGCWCFPIAGTWAQLIARFVPHPCQNALALTVMRDHSGEGRRRGDLDSGRYLCRPNKPDKEAVELGAILGANGANDSR
jgi:hypothetical protein